jgi:Zn-dependent protease
MDQPELSWPPASIEPVSSPAQVNPFGHEPATRLPLAEQAQSPFAEQASGDARAGRWRSSPKRRLGGAAAGAAALIAKFAAQLKALLFLLPKAKLLVTAGSAFVSVAAYSLLWGWQFAIGFVVLIFVHEMGHVIQLRREGISASAPTFIPFLGAVIASRSLGGNALAEAKVGLAGPVLGTLGAAVCLAIGETTNSPFFLALAYVGFLINLFNLIPVVPLDGGRAMAAMAPMLWFLGFGAIVAATFAFHNPFMVVIALFAGLELWRRWQHRRSGSLQAAAYYRVAPRARLFIGLLYIGLVALLAAGMDVSYVARTIR